MNLLLAQWLRLIFDTVQDMVDNPLNDKCDFRLRAILHLLGVVADLDNQDYHVQELENAGFDNLRTSAEKLKYLLL
jgi:hypothetical protein